MYKSELREIFVEAVVDHVGAVAQTDLDDAFDTFVERLEQSFGSDFEITDDESVDFDVDEDD